MVLAQIYGERSWLYNGKSELCMQFLHEFVRGLLNDVLARGLM